MPFTTIAEYEALKGPDALTTAEKSLIETTRARSSCLLGGSSSISPKVPQTPSDANTIRAELLRLLVLGGTPQCGLPEVGVSLSGGWIKGCLDLRYCAAKGEIDLNACHFDTQPNFEMARLRLLSLKYSILPGLKAQGVKIDGDLRLRGIAATHTINVQGAEIGGHLDCTAATLKSTNFKSENTPGAKPDADICRRTVTAVALAAGDGDGEAGIGIDSKFKDPAQNNGEYNALNAQGVNVSDSIFLRCVTATGIVAVSRARIGGDLNCNDATFDGAGSAALRADRVTVAASFLFHRVKVVKGLITLSSAHIGELADDPTSWPVACNDLILAGLTYDQIAADSPVTLSARRQWLADGAIWMGQYNPHPYTQLAKVLRAMGHPVEARRVMIEANVQRALNARATLRAQRSLQQQVGLFSQSPTEEASTLVCKTIRTMPTPARDWAKALRTRFNNIHYQPTDLPNAPPPLPDMTLALARQGFQNDMRSGALWCQIKRFGNKLGNGLLRWTVGFGYAPKNSLFVLAGLILAASILAQATWNEGSFAPNSDVILTSPGWTDVVARGCVLAETPVCVKNPAAVWSAANAPGMDWDSFYALAYAADLVVPLVDLGQTAAWAPSKDRGAWGCTLWAARWVFIILGWIVASLGLAAVTGFIQRTQPD